MKDILIYSTPTCGYCTAAKSLLTAEGYEFTEVMLTNQDAIAKYKEDCPGQTTVPQILIDGVLLEDGYNGLANKIYGKI